MKKLGKPKSPKKSPKVPPLVPQPNGRGAIYQGGVPGNAGGGRPKDVVREKLAELAKGKGFRFLDELMDGKARFRLVGTCEKCGHEATEPLNKSEMDAMWDEIKATIDHRLKANDQILKYGLGQKDEMTVVSPEIIGNLQAQVAIIGSKPVWDSQELLDQLSEVWK